VIEQLVDIPAKDGVIEGFVCHPEKKPPLTRSRPYVRRSTRRASKRRSRCTEERDTASSFPLRKNYVKAAAERHWETLFNLFGRTLQ
jgi:hypothetical protein